MFSGQGCTATLRNHRCFSRAGIVGGGEASGAASAGFFVRGNFTFRGVKWRWGWVGVSPLRQFPV
jgi:hypothetical protein